VSHPTKSNIVSEQAVTPSITIGMLLFPGLTQLDLTGPLEVFARIPGARIFLVAKSMAPIVDDHGLLRLRPTATFHNCPILDLLFVPGGPGQIAVMDDTATIDFVHLAGINAKVVSSVCSGSLILAAAGLLHGRRATCHWSSIDQLSILGAIPIKQRVVVDRDRITGAGVSAGIDLALTIISELFGGSLADEIQLSIEYDPEPPTRSGSPATATADILAKVRARSIDMLSHRRDATRRAKSRLGRYSS